MTTDFLVIGGGVIGINIARAIKRRFADSCVTVIEKETSCGLHASGRNSGVLHAGFYYFPDSLKARFTRLGNQLLTEYCERKALPIRRCGKLVVAKDPQDHPVMDELLRRANSNGIPLQEVTEVQAHEIEPRVKMLSRALYSPTTSTVDPRQVLEMMVGDAQEDGVEIHRGTRYVKNDRQGVLTSGGLYDAGYVVNAAGLYADQIAQDFGFAEHYRILPFKGLYLYSEEPPGAIRTNIYPVPAMRNPFLGVHITVTAGGQAKIGPTAIPTFWREQYKGWANFDVSELKELLVRQASLVLHSDFDFKRLAFQELKKYSRTNLIHQASTLVEGFRPENFQKWGQPGIRAQLINMKLKKMEMDFVVEGNDRSMHVLNAVSPGFTCSLPFSEYVCERISTEIGSSSGSNLEDSRE
jgi:L-2-hydroxyglutarate oxidase LhgO